MVDKHQNHELGQVDETQSEMLMDLREDLHALRARVDGTSSRVWEVATRLAVPVAVFLTGWLWDVDRRADRNGQALIGIERRVDALPPEWMSALVNELKGQNLDILQRLSSLEGEVRALPRKDKSDD